MYWVGVATRRSLKIGWEEIEDPNIPVGWREEVLWCGWFGLVYEKRKLQ